MTNNANRFSWIPGDDYAITKPGRPGNRQRHLSPHPEEEILEQQSRPSHPKSSSNNIRTTPCPPPKTFDQILGVTAEPEALEQPSLSRVRHTERPLRDRYQAGSSGVPPETSGQASSSTDRNEVLRSGGVRKSVQAGVSTKTQSPSSSQPTEKPRLQHVQQLHPQRTVQPGPQRTARLNVQSLSQPRPQGIEHSRLQGTDQAHLQQTDQPSPQRTVQPRLQRTERPSPRPRPLHTERSLPLLTSQPPQPPQQQPSINSPHPPTLSSLRAAPTDPYTHSEHLDWINSVNIQNVFDDPELMSSAIRWACRNSRAFDLPPSETKFEPRRLLRRSSSMNAMPDEPGVMFDEGSVVPHTSGAVRDECRSSLFQNISVRARDMKRWLQEPVGTPPAQK